MAHSFLAPSIVFCRKLETDKVELHQLVGFAQSANGKFHCLGLVVGERSSASETRIAVALLKCSVGDVAINERTLVMTLTDQERAEFDPDLQEADLVELRRVVGTVAKGTNIGQLKFELFGSPAINAGSLLRVTSSAKPVFYQVFDGVIEEERTVHDSTRAFVEGLGEQIGYWDNVRGGFETHDWVAKERAQVHLVDTEEQAPAYELKGHEVTVGRIPQSSYLTNINLDDLILYHTAVLGVTGSGKSFLTYSLVEACALRGIKIVCIDPTGDYQRYLHDAVLVTNPAQIKALLGSVDYHVGVLETAASQTNPTKQTLDAASTCLEWCKANRQPEDILNPQPRVLIVLEEAHLLAPEWNFNPEQGMQANVNKTAQVVLQARKYGLGFLVISQRTANVTKSILNQCNTVVSFQAFDETGFEFLKNYMGPYHVRSLPNLKPRHGILVGKASRSRRPVMVHFTEQQRVVREQAAQVMPLPPQPEQAAPPAHDALAPG